MYKIYSAFILSLLALIYFMAREKPDPSTSKEPSNVLPLTLINLGDSCINPSKVEIDSWVSEVKLFKGAIAFSAEFEGDQVFMCAIKTPINAKPSLLPNEDNCTYPMKFKEMDPLKCFYEPEPVIRKIEMKIGPVEIKDVPCGPEKRGKMYRFVYEICMTENEIENKKLPGVCNFETNSIKYRSVFEIYRFCYDENKKSVIHTEHKILSPSLLSNRKLKQEREKSYEMMIDNRNYLGLDLETLKTKYTQLENQTEQKENSADHMQDSSTSISFQKPSNDKVQKLVPSDDFAFALWRKPTFHYLNLKPMRKELTKLWGHINKLIRNDAIKRNREYYIHTGAYTKTADQTNTNTKNKNSPETVDFWVKIIYYFQGRSKRQNDTSKNKALVILMDNNLDQSSVGNSFDEYGKCSTNLCENAFTRRFPQIGKYIRCCSVTNIEAFIKLDLKVDEDLEVDFLYDD